MMNFVTKICTLAYLSFAFFEAFSTKCQCHTFNSTVTTVLPESYLQTVVESSSNMRPSVIDLQHRSLKFVPKIVLNRKDATNLNLEDNRLTQLPRFMENLKSLEVINLVHNNINNISEARILNKLPRLRELLLSRNPLKSLNGLRVNSLLTLNAEYCEIEEIDDLLPNSLPVLKTLNLTGNPLKTVRRLMSETLTNLVLKGCHLTNLHSDAFQELSNLEFLDLRDNELKTLPNNVFLRNGQLRNLSLANNKLEYIGNGWFNQTKNLEILDLSGNKITTSFDMNSLEHVTTNNSDITNTNILTELPHLRKLMLSRNPLKSLNGLRLNSLLTLEVDFCEISNTRNLFLNGLPSLTILNLTGNPLETFDKVISKSLTDLLLKSCHLTNLSFDAFDGLSNLEYLDLRNNQLKTLPDDIFSKNNHLLHLSLGNNILENLRTEWFKETKNLETLDLSENQIAAINDSVFVAPSVLKILDLHKNNITSVTNLKTAAFYVDLSRNAIGNKRIWDLSNMTRIRRLDLSHNRLDGNCGAFRSTTLSILILGYNRMSRITKDCLAGLPHLTDLSFRGNQLSTGFSPTIFQNNRILVNIELNDNPWNCNCTQLYRMYSFYRSRGQNTETGHLVCESPKKSSGRTWSDVCSSDWRDIMVLEDQLQISKTWIITISVICGSFLILGTLMYMICIFKKNRSARSP